MTPNIPRKTLIGMVALAFIVMLGWQLMTQPQPQAHSVTLTRSGMMMGTMPSRGVVTYQYAQDAGGAPSGNMMFATKTAMAPIIWAGADFRRSVQCQRSPRAIAGRTRSR